MDQLPLIIAPHPVNDLLREDIEILARAAFPILVEQLTQNDTGAPHRQVDFVHPRKRNTWGASAPQAGGSA